MTSLTIIEDTIKNQINQNSVLLYMKGSPQFPMCGYSARVAKILMNLNAKFAYVNILENPEIRKTLPNMVNWPTYPQLFINGELIGGCDIVEQLNDNNQLKPYLEKAQAIVDRYQVSVAE